jgi:hypothetical protein
VTSKERVMPKFRVLRKLLVVAIVVAVLATGAVAGAGADRDELLYVGSGTQVTAVSPVTGSVAFTQAGAVPRRDWSRLYTAETSDAGTVVRTLDARTGDTTASRLIRHRAFNLRVVSDDGRTIALSANASPDPYHPQPRAFTTLAIVRRGETPREYLVKGNVEPEAFSLSTRSLFVIEFTPPLAPERYRVARVDLTDSRSPTKARAVRSDEDELQEPMRGTARAQTLAPDGRRLYTLYTRDATGTEPAEAFVHVLDLQRERATCVDLPLEFATSSVGAVAVSPTGTRLYVVAPAAAALAEIDTAALRVTRIGHLPEPSTESMVRATVLDSRTLYVAVSGKVTTIDLGGLSVSGEWYVSGTVTGIQPAADASFLYVSLTDRVLAVDANTGTTQQEFAVPLSGRIDHVAPALRPIVSEHDPGYVQCAC